MKAGQNIGIEDRRYELLVDFGQAGVVLNWNNES
jgi:hypothetical protein